MNTDIQVSKENQQWLRDVDTIAQILEKAPQTDVLNPDHEMTFLEVFAESMGRINHVLGLLSVISKTSGDVDDDLPQWMTTVFQDLAHLLPKISRIYDARKHLWFKIDAVVEHEHCYGHTWSEIVIQTAMQFEFVYRRISLQRVSDIMRTSQYESAKVLCHLELEVEQVRKHISANRPLQKPPAEYVSFKKQFLQWFFDRTDKVLLSRLEEFGIKVHPEDVYTPRHSMRLELLTLVETDLHEEESRAKKLKEFQDRKK